MTVSKVSHLNSEFGFVFLNINHFEHSPTYSLKNKFLQDVKLGQDLGRHIRGFSYFLSNYTNSKKFRQFTRD